MKLIAQKPCSFGGKKFYIGDEIPAESVLNPRVQARLGVLAIVPDDAGITPPDEEKKAHITVDTMTVVIRAEEGDMPLNITAEGLQSVVDVLTSNVENAEPIVAAMTDDSALILLHAADYRKGIKEAAAARAQALEEEKSNAGQQNPDGTDTKGQQNPEESAGDQ